MPIENHGKGAIPRPPDSRDFKIASLGPLPPADFNVGLRLPDPGNEDQGSSSSCVAHAFSYYHNQIHPADYSRRDLYARIFLPQGGAYLANGAGQVAYVGQSTRDEVPDPSPETEANMRDKSGVTAEAQASHKEQLYYSLGADIDTVAAAIKAFKGVVIGVTGSNPGWQDMTSPRPPKAGETTWGHALYCMGYHLHNGLKCIIAKSSWCNEVPEHHINISYFQSGNTFDNLALVPRGVTADRGIMMLPDGRTEAVYVKIATAIKPIAQIASFPDVGLTLSKDGKTVIFYSKEGSQFKIDELKDALEIPPGDPIVPSSSL